MLGAMFNERTLACGLSLTQASAPLPAPKMIHNVFRSYAPGGSGLEFGAGLSPFSIVCEGHQEVDQIKKMIGNASLVEAGSGVTLRDMTTIVSHDTRFPTEPYVVCEKLQGWSVVVDVFHGNTHPVSVSIRAAVKEIHPCLNRLAIQMGDDEGGGMDLLTRVMFDMQHMLVQFMSSKRQSLRK